MKKVGFSKTLALLTALCMVLTLVTLPVVPTMAYTGTLDLSAPRTINAANGNDVLVSGAGTQTANTVTVAADFDGSITLQDVNISGAGSPITVQAGADVTFILEGENTLTSTNNAAMQIAPGAEVVIKAKVSDAADSLTVKAGGQGAGIHVGTSGKIADGDAIGAALTIESGKITANGAGQGAGIGSGGADGSGNGYITINGGVVTAASSDVNGYSGAGIGSGGVGWNNNVFTFIGDITINGGTVTATAGDCNASAGAGIGTGGFGLTTNQSRVWQTKITITGGTVLARGGNSSSAEAGRNGGGAGIGLGSGSANNITTEAIVITGGDITAVGGYNTNFGIRGGAGIGGGGLGSNTSHVKNIILTGGNIIAQAGGPAPTNAAAIGAGHHGGMNLNAGNVLIGANVKIVKNSPEADDEEPNAAGDIGGSSTNGATCGVMDSLIVLPGASFAYVEYDEDTDEYIGVEGTPTFSGVAAGKAFWLNAEMPPETITSTVSMPRRINITTNDTVNAEVFANFGGYNTLFGTIDSTLLAGVSDPINPMKLGTTGGAANNLILQLCTNMTSANVEFTASGFDPTAKTAADMVAGSIVNVLLINPGLPTPSPTPEPESFIISQYASDPSGGIKWRIEGTADTVEHGQFANGDWWVVGPVTILEITPSTAIVGDGAGRITMHGSMINPGASPSNAPQGFDSRIYGSAPGYADNKNVGYYMPLEVNPGSSLLSSRSFVESVPDPQGSPQLETIAVLTVLEEAAQPGDFRPPYIGSDKSLNWNIADLDYSKLRSLPRVQGNDRAGNPITPDLAHLEMLFERPKMEYNTIWTGRNTHPHLNHRGLGGGNGIYGREIANANGAALLSLNLDYTNAQKETLLIEMVQYGIDLYGSAKNGGIWYNDGGHNQGRKMVLLLAAHMLDDENIMEYVTKLAPDGRRLFQEDNSTGYTTQAIIDRPMNWDGDRPRAPYTNDMLGMPDWIVGGGSSWNIPYREISAASQLSGILTAHLMGLREVWDWPALFEYSDRFAEVEIFERFTWEPIPGLTGPSGRRASMLPLAYELWKTYRPNVSTNTDFIIYDQNMGLPMDKAEFSVKYNGSNAAGAELRLVAQKYDASNNPVGAPIIQEKLLPIDKAWTIADIPYRVSGQPHPTPLPDVSIQRGPSFTMKLELPEAEERYEYYIETGAGVRISPIFHKAAGGQEPEPKIGIVSVTPQIANSRVTVGVSNPKADAIALIVAVYDGGKLLSVKAETTSAQGDIAVNGVAFPANAKSVKVMLWENLQSMKPLCGAVTATW